MATTKAESRNQKSESRKQKTGSRNRILIFLALTLLGFSDDKDKGREGNKRYHDKKYEEAAGLFRQGIALAAESTDEKTRAALANNLGCALNRLQSYEEASAAFSEAIQLASNNKELTRSAYNAGNNAFQAQDPERSLTYYREALLADPANEDARFNYEFVKRFMDQQQQSGGEGDPQQNPQDQPQQDQQQEQDQQQQEEDQQQQEQNGENSQQEQEQSEEEQEQQSQPEEQEPGMSEEQAEQILQALHNDEQDLMRQVWRMKGKPRAVDKDW